MATLLRRLRYLFNRERYERELAEEIETHRAMVEERLLPSVGQEPPASRRVMGNITLAREDARGVWVWSWLDSTWQDVRYAVRNLGREPGFAILALATLGIGIGVNTSLLTVFSALFLRPWPVPDPSTLFEVTVDYGSANSRNEEFSFPEYLHLREHARSVSGLIASACADNREPECRFTLDDERVSTLLVSRNYFDVLGIAMEQGPGLAGPETRQDAVAVISYALWQQRFASDRAIIGKTVHINSVPFTVLGVAPRDFGGTSFARKDVWIPLGSRDLAQPHAQTPLETRLAARLGPDVARQHATSELDALHRRYRADVERLIGRTITLDDVPVMVVGVTAAGFAGTKFERVDLWLPLAAAAVFRPNERWVRDEISVGTGPGPRLSGYLALAGRLAPGATRAQAEAELTSLAMEFDPSRRRGGRGLRTFGTAGADAPGGVNTAAFLQMFGAVLAVLLLACANVGNLLLARAHARRREIAMRLSLGASRSRVVRQLLVESFVLALGAGALGLLLTLHLPRLALEAAARQPTALQLRPDLPVLGFTFAICALACLLFGLAPALHATRRNVSDALKGDAPLQSVRFSVRNALLSVQVALSVILLVAGGLLIRGVQHAHRLDHGFDVGGVTLMSFEPPVSSYDAARTRVFTQQLAQQLDTLAQRVPIGITHVAPFGSGNLKGTYLVPGSSEELFNAVYEVSPSYFNVLRIPVLRCE